MKDVSEAFENIRSEKTATAISGFLSIFPEETSPEALGVLSDREEAGRTEDMPRLLPRLDRVPEGRASHHQGRFAFW